MDGIVIGIAATVIVAYVVYRRQARESESQIAFLRTENRELREEVERLRTESREVPRRVVDLLLAEGIIPRARETDARSSVMHEFPTVTFTVTPSGTDTLDRPTDVSGGAAHGPDGPPPETR